MTWSCSKASNETHVLLVQRYKFSSFKCILSNSIYNTSYVKMSKTNTCNALDTGSGISNSKKMKPDYILEPDFINYISVPSLESIAITNIVIELWKQPDLREDIEQHTFEFNHFHSFVPSERDQSFHKIEEKVSRKLDILPNLLKDKASYIIKPIGLQILEGLVNHNKDYLGNQYVMKKDIKHIIDSIKWTVEGTIDELKTLNVYLSYGNLKHIDSMYKAACLYCAEEHIVNLWKQISDEKCSGVKSSFFSQDIYKSYTYHLVAYWTSFAKNELTKFLSMIKPSDHYDIYECNHSIYKNMFTLSVSEGNALAAKYFWKMLMDEEITNNMVEWVDLVIQRRKCCNDTRYQKSNGYTNILCFLLSQMNNKEQQRETFQKYKRVILESLFLNWPWQKFLLPTIRVMWDFLDGEAYVILLSRVVEELGKRVVQELLKELWYDSPIHLKKCFIQYIIHDRVHTNVLLKLLKVEDAETIKLILNDANVEAKKQIIFSTISATELCELIYRDKLTVLEAVIQENLSFEYEINSFKREVIRSHGCNLCRRWICDDNWQLLEKFLDWGFISQEEKDKFKKNCVTAVVDDLICVDGYELINKFMNWCFSSDKEIIQFKKDLINYNWVVDRIISLSRGDFSLFEKFIDWSFTSDDIDEEIKKLKIHLSHYDIMEPIIDDVLLYKYNFEFAEKLLVWCYSSDEIIKQFKSELMFSDDGIEMFYRFVFNYKVYDSEYTNWELTKKLTEWFYPFEKKVIIKFKKKFKRKVCGFKSYANKSFFQLLDSFVTDSDSNDSDDDTDRYTTDSGVSSSSDDSGKPD